MQQTISREVTCSGIGVHSGRTVHLTVKPAPVNHGVQFVRTDLPNRPCIPARFNKVVDTSLATVLGSDGIIISTIEHLMAAFSGMAIDNTLVEVDAHEMPIMDGFYPDAKRGRHPGPGRAPLLFCHQQTHRVGCR